MMIAPRVRYRERQPLHARDLDDEQAYRLAGRRRHNVGPHGWGIVAGLSLAAAADGVWVQPGMAVDGYGRELIVPEPVPIADDVYDRLENETLDVWLLYRRVAETPAQRGRWDCGPGQHSRWREEARLRLTAVQDVDSDVDPRMPPSVPLADLDFSPHELPPDDPGREWPVYLGRIQRDGTTYVVRPAKRPYAGLVGEIVAAPSGRADAVRRARMQVGSEAAGDRRRFVVSLADESGAFTDRLTIDRDGNTALCGDVTLKEGNLILAPAEARSVPVIASRLARLCGRLDGSTADEDQVWSLAFGALATAPEEAMPWRVYHTVVTQDDRPIHQLRLEIGHPGNEGDPARHRLAVGSWSDDEGRFQPCLTVDANCAIVIRGNVTVQGSIKEGPIPADPNDPRFTEAVGTRWAQGLLVTGAGTLYGTGLEMDGISCERVDDLTVTYHLTVHNVSGGPITNIHVVQNLSVDRQSVRRGLMVPEFDLSAGSSQDIEHTYESLSGPLVDREIVFAVTALGLGPSYIPVSTSVTQTLVCQSGPVIG